MPTVKLVIGTSSIGQLGIGTLDTPRPANWTGIHTEPCASSVARAACSEPPCRSAWTSFAGGSATKSRGRMCALVRSPVVTRMSTGPAASRPRIGRTSGKVKNSDVELTAATLKEGSWIGSPKSEANWIATVFPSRTGEKPPLPRTSASERKMPSSCPGWTKGAFVAPIFDGFMRRGCEEGQLCHLTACAVVSVPSRHTPTAAARRTRGVDGTVPTGLRIIRAPPGRLPGSGL